MDRLKRLVEARDLLAQAIKACESNRDLAALLFAEYSQTLAEIDALPTKRRRRSMVSTKSPNVELLGQHSNHG